MICFGFDTSNYTTSAAAFGDGVCVNKSRLLPVPVSARGLRQSEALFHHVKALPELFGELCRETGAKADAVAVSDAPRRAEGSYMPCFLAGVNGAEILSKGLDVPLFRFSHQEGHLAAAAYSAWGSVFPREKRWKSSLYPDALRSFTEPRGTACSFISPEWRISLRI